MKGVIVVNEASGADATDPTTLRDAFPDFDLVVAQPDELDDVLDETCARSDLEVIGIAGGDGTISAAAQRLAQGDVALLPIPGGTRNHFACDLDLADVDAAARAAASDVRRRVDTAIVADQRFINNASIGWYPAMVRRREAAERSLPKAIAHPLAVAQEVRRAERFDVEVDGTHHQVLAVFIGNGRYGEGLADLAERESLDDGVLDVWTVRAGARFARLRLFAALSLGRLARSPLIERRSTSSVTVDVSGPRSIDVALDGEIRRLDGPLTFACDPRSLLVVAQPGEPSPAG